MFIEVVVTKDGKEASMEIHISKASKSCKDLERQGIKFRLGKVIYHN